MKVLGKILKYLLLVMVLAVFAAFIFLQTSYVQNKASQIALEKLQELFDADISLGKIAIKPFTTLSVQDLVVVDKTPFNEQARDTLAAIGSLSARFSLFSLIGPGHQDVKIRRLNIRDAQVNLVIEGGEESTNLVRMFHLLKYRRKEPIQKDIFEIQEISLNNIHFTMRNFTLNKTFPATAINWLDMDVRQINASASNFRMSHGKFYADLHHLEGIEKSGWQVTHFSGSTICGLGDAYLYNLYLTDAFGSEISLDYRMLGKTEAYKDYVHKVNMDIDVKDSHMSLKTLSFFIPPLGPDSNTFVKLKGQANGTVDNLSASNARIRVEGSSIRTTLNGNVKRLPDYTNMLVDAKLSDTEFTSADATRLLHSVAPKASKVDLRRFGKGELFRGTLKVKGQLNKKLECSADFSQGRSNGHFQLDANVMDLLSRGTKAISVDGRIGTQGLELGKLLGMDILGRTSLDAQLAATLPFQGEPLSASVSALQVDSITVNGYAYKDINGTASLYDTDLTLGLVSKDPNCDADININTDKYAYNASAIIRNANLSAMNIDKRDKSNIALNLYGHLDKDIDRSLDYFQGNANITDIVISSNSGPQEISDITVTAEKNNGVYDINLNCEELDGFFKGNKESLTANFNTRNTTNLLSFLLPGAYLDYGTKLNVTKEQDGMIHGDITSRRIALRSNYIKDISGTILGTMEDLDAEIHADEINAAGVTLHNNNLNLCLVDNLARIQYSFLNQGEQKADGEISVDAVIGKGKRLAIDVNPSHFCVDDGTWFIPSSHIDINGRNISVDNFRILNNNQSVYINGKTSENSSEKLSATLQNIDIDFLNGFISRFDLELDGRLNADCEIKSPLVSRTIPEIAMNLQLDSLYIGENDLGRITAVCAYDHEFEHFNIVANEKIKGQDALLVSAIFEPKGKTLDGSFTFDDFPIAAAQRFVPTVFSSLDGRLNGDVFVNGPIDRLDINSRGARADDVNLEVAFTHVPYHLQSLLHLDNNGIHLVDAKGSDRFGASATATGGVRWDRFRNMEMNVHINCTDLEALNIPPNNPDTFFYGHIFATGTVDLTGPFNAVLLSANAHTTQNSDIHFAMSESMDATKGNLLTFVDPNFQAQDAYEIMLSNYRRHQKDTEFKLKLHATADPSFTVLIDLGNPTFSAILQGNGNGVIDLDVNAATKEYSILGDYSLSEGRVEVNANNIVRRIFQVNEGSSIRFGGDIFESTVNLTAKYETKASIESLVAEKDAVSSRRTVECGISIQDKLKNPSIKFNIDIPDLNPNTRMNVESALSTEDQIQKQFLSLLLSNSFLPDEQNNIVNNSSLLYSNVSEIMSNQINNILNKLDIPLDLGLKYQPTETGANLFDVAVSTQLFNNRVIIGGNFGNKQNLASASGTLFGDFDIQYKVTRSGAFRIKAFSHSADQYSNYLDNGQRNGVGLSWQQEFDSFPEWFKRLFSSKAKKEALSQMELDRPKKQKTIILDE